MSYPVSGDPGSEQSFSDGGDADSGTIYELDVSGTEDALTPQGAGATAAPAAPAPPDPTIARLEAIERANAATHAELGPVLAHLQAQQRASQQSRPPVDLSRIDTDPNIKPSDVLAAIEWKLQQGQQQAVTQAEYRAAALMSEQTARGQFNATTLGAGNDYDSMVSRYVAPLARQNPYVDALIQQVFPSDPGTGRMFVAAVIAAVENAGGDMVQGLKNVLSSRTAYAEGAEQTRQSMGEVARVAAARVQRAGKSSATLSSNRKILRTREDVMNLPEREYDKLWNSAGQSARH